MYELKRVFIPNKRHCFGLAFLLIGVIILISGISIMYRINNAVDFSSIPPDKVKSNMYVKCRAERVLTAVGRESASGTRFIVSPYCEDSRSLNPLASQNWYISELTDGKYALFSIDSEYYPDEYKRLNDGGTIDSSRPIEFVAFVKNDKESYDANINYVNVSDNYLKDFKSGDENAENFNEEHFFPLVFDCVNTDKGKNTALVSLPFLIIGIFLLIRAGIPFDYIRISDKEI